MGRKRKIPEEDAANLAKALDVPGVAESAAYAIWNIAREGCGREKPRSREVLKRVSSKRLEQPLDVYDPIKFLLPDGGESTVFLADIHKLLHWVLNNVPEWQSVLRGLASGDDPVANLRAILYYDEVVCGNILTVHKRKKILAIYLSFKELWLVLCYLSRVCNGSM